MTTSGSTNFNVDRDQIIKGALRLIGAIAQGENPTTDQVTEASEALNLMVKAWEADGMPLWGLSEYALSVTSGQTGYQIGLGYEVNIPKPLKIIQAFNRNTTTNIDIPMRVVTKQEYNMLGNKTTTGLPIQLYYDPQRDYGKVYLFPTPDSIAEAQNKIHIIYQRPFEDFDTSTDNPDFPQEWLEALKYGLAQRLAPEYGVPLDQRQALAQEAMAVKAIALSFGTEEGSMFFQQDKRYW